MLHWIAITRYDYAAIRKTTQRLPENDGMPFEFTRIELLTQEIDKFRQADLATE